MKRSYVTHTTQNYESITINLVESIKKYSEYPILVYTIDYDASPYLKSIAECKRLDLNLPVETEDDFFNKDGNLYVNRGTIRTFLTLSSKVDVLLDVCDTDIDEWVYLDSDCILNLNGDDLFDFQPQIKEVPLATKGPHQFVLVTKNDEIIGNPFWKGDGSVDLESTLEYPLMKFFGMSPNERINYHTTNIILGNSNCKNFISLWFETKNLFAKLVDLKTYCPFHEETIYNVLLWKYKLDGLPMLYINLVNSSTLEHFFSTDGKPGELISTFYRLPEEKNNIKVFHGEKRRDEIIKIFNILDNLNTPKNENPKTKLLYLAPHLSTGGMPAFVLKRLQSMLEFYSENYDIYFVEFTEYSPTYVVQKNIIKGIIPTDKYWTLSGIGGDKSQLIDIIKKNNIQLIHVDEILEGFDHFNKVPVNVLNDLYSNDRTWRIIETCHNVWFNPEESKHFNPDGYAFCSPWHKEKTFKNMSSPSVVTEFPIENKIPTKEQKYKTKLELGLDPSKTHVLNVGLWTSGKNQGEGVDIARLLYEKNQDFHFHFIGNQAINFQSYWGPIMENLPPNVTVWGEKSDVDDFMIACDIFLFNSTWECNPLVLREAASHGLKIFSRNLPQYMDMFTPYIVEIDNNLISSVDKILNSGLHCDYKIPENHNEIFAKTHHEFYQRVLENKILNQEPILTQIKVNRHFVNGPFLELLGESDKQFLVEYFDENDVCHYSNVIGSNNWIRLNREYFTKWRYRVSEGNNVLLEETIDLKNKRVFISFDSHSLGDTIAWIPYCEKFRLLHDCEVIVACKFFEFFKDVYPNIEFVPPGSSVHNIFAMYKLGWFYDDKKEPEKPNLIPLQKQATNILGLPFKEIKPNISYQIKDRKWSEKYITIATHSTAGLKYWNNPSGWQELVDYLIGKGYKVIHISKEKTDLKNVTQLKDTSMENTLSVIHHSEFFIGLSSGLSWLSWAVGKHVVMISNFTEPDHEFTTNTTRIINQSVCNGCWNKDKFKFDKGDWYWCPEHKNTPRHFECHKSITSQMVIDKIKHLL
jgi:autotransporter strand-loop-strand O-heptosyltransferase